MEIVQALTPHLEASRAQWLPPNILWGAEAVTRRMKHNSAQPLGAHLIDWKKSWATHSKIEFFPSPLNTGGVDLERRLLPDAAWGASQFRAGSEGAAWGEEQVPAAVAPESV